MVGRLPAAVVPKTLELERRMLEEDVEKKRTLPMDDVRSILSFCRFIEASLRGGECLPIVVPADHLEFYRETLERLIQNNVLSADARTYFDRGFSKYTLKLKTG